MKVQLSRLLAVLAVSAAVLGTTSPVQAVYNPNGEQPKPRMLPGLVSVQLEDNVDPAATAKAFGRVSFGVASLDALLADLKVADARKIFPWQNERPKLNSGQHDLSRFFELSFPPDQDVRAVVRSLRQNPNVRMAEPVWEMPLLATPNDPQWSQQWAMEPGPPDPDFYDAWDIENGSDSVIFGCIDSGVNYKHADLAQNVWVNPGEDLDGDRVVFDPDDLNSVDDDGNGIVDDLIGYDFLTSAGSVWPGEDGGGRDPDPNDHNGHGTHVAGIAAAATNNGINVTGAAGGWFGGHRAYRGVRIMCLRVGYTGSDGNGYVNTNDCAAAINYAVMMGADVINESWGGSYVSAIASSNAVAAGVTVCHAAGNDNASTGDEIDDMPGVLSVASVGPQSDIKSSFSNYGYWVDVCAPGSSILSTYSNAYVPTTATLGGTSMASPMVAGLALLVRSAMPSLTRFQCDSIILVTTDSVEAVNNPLYWYQLGSGRINALKALQGLGRAKFTSTATDGNVPLTVDFTDLSPLSPTSWLWSFGTGAQSTDQNPSYIYTEPGVYDVSLIVDDTASIGNGEEHLRRYIWARADTLKVDSVEVRPGDTVVYPIFLRNTAQASDIMFAFQLENHNGQEVQFLDYSVAGTRTGYFESTSMSGSDLINQRFAIRLRSNTGTGSSWLPADTGVILNLRFLVANDPTPDLVVVVDTATINGNAPRITTAYGDYWPAFSPGYLVVRACAHGDSNCDDKINVSDLTFLVNYLFKGGAEPDTRGGDVNADSSINVTDLTFLVNYLFKSGPPPPSK